MARREPLRRVVATASGVLTAALLLLGLIGVSTWGGPNGGDGGDVPFELLAMFVIVAVTGGVALAAVAREIVRRP